VANVT
jgi:hypothetical protein